jgi:hypothetical protein
MSVFFYFLFNSKPDKSPVVAAYATTLNEYSEMECILNVGAAVATVACFTLKKKE